MVFNCLKRTFNAMDVITECTPRKVALVERNVAPRGIELLNTEVIAKKSPNDLVELAVEIQKADNFVKTNTHNKLQVIAEQMKFLHQKAQHILLEAKENAALNNVECNFVKHPGNIYHLYKRESGQLYFSILSPQEWGEFCPKQIYKGSYRLEHDYSWTPLSEVTMKDKELEIINKLYQITEKSTNPSLAEYMSVDYN